MTQKSIAQHIATEISASENQVSAAIMLLDEGATVPFIARYRKEKTGGLDDSQLRELESRLLYLRELADRRHAIIKSITEQDKLTPQLQADIDNAVTKQRLEDLYLPYKPKRRNKAVLATEAGLLPLAEELLADPSLVPEVHAQSFINPEKDIIDVKLALEGARHILMERFSEDAELVTKLRDYVWQHASIVCQVVPEHQSKGEKFKDYFDYCEAVNKIPSHRVLAIFRGRKEGILNISLAFPGQETSDDNPCEAMIAHYNHISYQGRPADDWLLSCVRWTWKIKLATKLELEIFSQIREQAETEAIDVFAKNLKDLLLASPAGAKVILGLDPGLRTGVKLAIVSQTGKLLATQILYPHVPKNQWQASLEILAKLCQQHQVDLISIGNGTASRETDKLVQELIKTNPKLQLEKLVVSEAGASVYSASKLAADEFPNLDVSLRGAVSIARRLQDPLAELVKIDPKSIGVGQYQHDVSQVKLVRSLTTVVEDCVNSVGVHVNNASEQLLAQVSGLNSRIAHNIVKHRDQHGAFRSREQLKQVAGVGDKTYQQAVGFLRIVDGDNPLDASAVHPESYPVVEKIMNNHSSDLNKIIGDKSFLSRLQLADYADEQFGLLTVKDIITELEKPGRDPRPEFVTAQFRSDVHEMTDLIENMILEGVVTNVANFGAFVDIGVHQDGMVHISHMSDKFIKDPRDLVKTGDIVKVKVMSVDLARKRIGLSMRLHDVAGQDKWDIKQDRVSKRQKKPQPNQPWQGNAMAEAFRNARQS